MITSLQTSHCFLQAFVFNGTVGGIEVGLGQAKDYHKPLQIQTDLTKSSITSEIYQQQIPSCIEISSAV